MGSFNEIGSNFGGGILVKGGPLTDAQVESLLVNDRDVYFSDDGKRFEVTMLNGFHDQGTIGSANLCADGCGLSVDANTESTENVGDNTEKLETLANELESFAGDLAAGNDSEAFARFESATGRMARAAEALRENPNDEDAIEEFEAAADELKEAVHGLEGEIDDDLFNQLSAAVDEFEKAADHLLGADDGDVEMANALAGATAALDNLVGATRDVMHAQDPLSHLDELTNQLGSIANDLRDKYGVEGFDKFESAVERLESAVDDLRENPNDEEAIEEFEAAADELQEATQGLKGKIDDGAFDRLASAVDDFEEVADKLPGLDGSEEEFHDVLVDAADKLDELVGAAAAALEDPVNPLADESEGNPVAELESMTDKLKAVSNDIGENLNVDAPELDRYEAAVDRLEASADELLKNPNDESALEEFEAAADELRDATRGLEGILDEDTYERATAAVDAFENAADGVLSADDGSEDLEPALYNALAALDPFVQIIEEQTQTDAVAEA